MTEDSQPTMQVLLAGVGGQLTGIGEALGGIGEALRAQADAAQGYRMEARRQTRQSRIMSVVVVLLLIATFWVGLGNRHLGQQISSCTSPTGDCARRSQAAQTAAIVTIIRCVLTLPRHATDAQITGCVLGAER